MIAMAKYVYFFGAGKAEGRADMKNLLGGKGANLAEMTNIGLPVPAGFTITTEMCTYYYDHHRQYPAGAQGLKSRRPCDKIEEAMGAKFGDPKNPMLVSCRSGGRDSMPGMMDTVLNIGLNDVTLQALDKNPATNASPWTAIAGSSRCTATCPGPQGTTTEDPFEHIMDEIKHKEGVKLDNELDAASLKTIIERRRRQSRSAPARTSPRTRTSRCGKPSAPCSARG